MLVSHRHRFIYTKTAKTAGTSVESYFERFCMEDGEWQQVHARREYESSAGIIGFRGPELPQNVKWWHHMPAVTIRKQLGGEIWRRYFKFCVIRNPYDKCISAFEHFGKHHRIRRFSLTSAFRTSGMTEEQRRFYDYVRRAAPIDRDKYVINGEFCLDDVIRYESLEDEIARICDRLDLPYEPEFLPSFKQGHRRPHARVETLYTPPARRHVAKIYAFELARFGYDFPLPESRL
jgi:hypothetical protein